MMAEPRIKLQRFKEEECWKKFREELNQVPGSGGQMLASWETPTEVAREIAGKFLGVARQRMGFWKTRKLGSGTRK